MSEPGNELLLAIDTTGETGSLALVGDAGVIEEVELHSPDGFAHVLFDEIGRLLARHGIGIERIGVFASASGPGSFTGVRVGLTAAKGLAEATGRKVIAVSNLQAMAAFGTRPLRAVVMDARRGEIYGAVYDARLDPVREGVVMKLEPWVEGLPSGDLEFITHGIAREALGDAALRHPASEAPRALAGAIGRIAWNRKQLARDPAEIDANYVRRSDAELLWKEPSSKTSR